MSGATPKRAMDYTTTDVIGLESRLLRAAEKMGGDEAALMREAASVLCSQAVRLSTIRQAIQ